jgi:hypothetical protein
VLIKVTKGWTSSVRKEWVKQIIFKKSGDILAVQTLRNSITGATILATISITLAVRFDF